MGLINFLKNKFSHRQDKEKEEIRIILILLNAF